MDKVLFFGYGANISREKIKQIINRDPGNHVGAVIENYILCSQVLSNLPEPPQKFLQQIYGGSFKAYTLKKGKGIVLGAIWEVTLEELETIKKWEFVGLWREMAEVVIKSSGGKEVKAFTEKSIDKFPVAQVVDGLTYDPFGFKEKEKSVPTTDPYYSQQQAEKIKQWLAEQAKNSTPQPSVPSQSKNKLNKVKDFFILKK
jgi:hypothetical protein